MEIFDFSSEIIDVFGSNRQNIEGKIHPNKKLWKFREGPPIDHIDLTKESSENCENVSKMCCNSMLLSSKPSKPDNRKYEIFLFSFFSFYRHKMIENSVRMTKIEWNILSFKLVIRSQFLRNKYYLYIRKSIDRFVRR